MKIVSVLSEVKDKPNSSCPLRPNHIWGNFTKGHSKGQAPTVDNSVSVFLVPTVEFFVHRAELAVGDVGINLRRRDIAVTEKQLNRTEVGAVAQEVGGETVAQSVRRHFFHNSSLGGVKMN